MDQPPWEWKPNWYPFWGKPFFTNPLTAVLFVGIGASGKDANKPKNKSPSSVPPLSLLIVGAGWPRAEDAGAGTFSPASQSITSWGKLAGSEDPRLGFGSLEATPPRSSPSEACAKFHFMKRRISGAGHFVLLAGFPLRAYSLEASTFNCSKVFLGSGQIYEILIASIKTPKKGCNNLRGFGA